MSSVLRGFWRLLDRVGWLVALVFLAAGWITLYGQGVKLNGQRVTVNELRTSQSHGCHRLNVVRAEDNRSQLHDFGLFTATAALVSTAIEHPQQHSTRAQRAKAAAYLAKIQGDALAKEWTPLTLCAPATYHPATYVEPKPIPFSKRLPPPQALRVGPGE
jgi:hypothetical protein